ncbi:hypothetical protein [Spartinivicinus poritis]|uniref:Uncharacterized protein n=1 Tax=Spartinivicinus poritis TaxID=2994640 RepID=A0ABT5U7X1_9GAMM|nr:hypothetical protein [Spartinivicinus sp. A2-2]MDE1462469.1 hypothetical protein [Spartinivicinus sp. A2-2]
MLKPVPSKEAPSKVKEDLSLLGKAYTHDLKEEVKGKLEGIQRHG